MAPKELTDEEMETVMHQLNSIYHNDFVVRTDNNLSKHIASYDGS